MLYADLNGEKKLRDLQQGDTLSWDAYSYQPENYDGPSFQSPPYTDRLYAVNVRTPKGWQQGYLNGRHIGTGVCADVDHDGKYEECLITHYLEYPATGEKGQDKNGFYPAEICLLKDHKVLGRIPYRGAYIPRWTASESTSAFGIPIFTLNYFNPTAGAHKTGSHLVYWDGNSLQMLPYYGRHDAETGTGVYYDFTIPQDKPNMLEVQQIGYSGFSQEVNENRYFGDEFTGKEKVKARYFYSLQGSKLIPAK